MLSDSTIQYPAVIVELASTIQFLFQVVLVIKPHGTGTAFMIDQHFAHTLSEKPPAYWQPLEEYLKNMADLVTDFINISLTIAIA